MAESLSSSDDPKQETELAEKLAQALSQLLSPAWGHRWSYGVGALCDALYRTPWGKRLSYMEVLQESGLFIIAMDAKELLEHLATIPPQPFSDGCAKIALRPFLRTLRIFGAYHEHDYYSEFTNPPKESRHYMNVVDIHNQDNLVVYTASEKTPGQYIADPVSQDPLFVTRQSNLNNGHVITAHDRSTDFRRRDKLNNNMAASVTDSVYPTNNDTVTTNINEGSLDPFSSASYSDTGHFLSRCAIVDPHVTRKMLSSLGYDTAQTNGPWSRQQTRSSSGDSRGFRLKSLWSDRTYAFIVMIFHWANFLRCVMYINRKDHVDVWTALIPILWFAMVAGCNTCMFVSCVRRDHFYTFFSKWTAIFKDPTSRSLGLRGVLNNRFISMAVVIHWAVCLTNVACIVFVMLMEDSFSAGMNILFYITGQRSAAVIALSAVSTLFTSASWIGTNIFIIIMCHHVETHFKEFGQVLQLHIAAAGNDFPRSLKLLRERHLAMCDNVSVLDRYMKFTIGISFSLFISLCCVMIYLLVRVHMDRSVMAVNVFWLVGCLILTGLPTYCMASVNVAMHSAGDALLTLQTHNMTLEQFGQLTMFLAKVNGPSMGFTVLGLIVVTRELLLTLFGIYLTYGIVLLQFP